MHLYKEITLFFYCFLSTYKKHEPHTVSVAGSDLEGVEFDLWVLRYRYPAKYIIWASSSLMVCGQSSRFGGGCRDAK